MAQVIADERAATIARENALFLAQRAHSGDEISQARPRFSLARLFRRAGLERGGMPRTSAERASAPHASAERTSARPATSSGVAPCPPARGVAASGC
ncbi:hypothetical protein [Microbacterium kyungheense]|nr:hypothetical protein [Microbacterium kyungheense]